MILSETDITDKHIDEPAQEGNTLFPVFLKLETLRLLIIGGGYVGLEKLKAVLANSPDTAVILVAESISNDIWQLALQHPNIRLIEKRYDSNDLDEIDVVIAAVNDIIVSEQIRQKMDNYIM